MTKNQPQPPERDLGQGPEHDPEINKAQTALTGWGFVAVQFALIIALVLSGPGNDWSVPAWLGTLSWILFGTGFVVMGLAALGLGLSLTPTPVPRSSGRLQTSGLYRYSRHPIYTGLLAVVAAITIRSASFITLAIAVVTVFFFHLKARWEEQQLAAQYQGYLEYAAKTPRFVPSLRLARRGGFD